MFYSEKSLRAQRSEFLNLKQGKMTVIVAIRNFERLERLCVFLKHDEEGRIRKMLERFHPDITIFVATSRQPTTMVECYEKALYVEFKLNWIKEE